MILPLVAATLALGQGGAPARSKPQAPRSATPADATPARLIQEANAKTLASGRSLAAGNRVHALQLAEEAEALTRDFNPLAFVPAGPKGELLGEGIDRALAEYRIHRAAVYSAWGAALSTSVSAAGESPARLGAPKPFIVEAILRRARALEPLGERSVALARHLRGQGDARGALSELVGLNPHSAASLALIESLSDDLRRPSAQAEIDVSRLGASGAGSAIRLRPRPSPSARGSLSTGAPVRLDGPGVTLVYYARAGCSSCSADLERLAPPPGVSVLLAAEDEATETVMRRVASLYKVSFPVLVGGGPRFFGPPGPDRAVIVARFGHLVVGLADLTSVSEVTSILSRRDIAEAVPRAAWNGRESPGPYVARTEDRRDEKGENPGIDMERLPVPERPSQASERSGPSALFADGRYAEALESLRAGRFDQDGLLPTDRRLNEATCLSRLGRRREAREILVRIGDAAAQERVSREIARAEVEG